GPLPVPEREPVSGIGMLVHECVLCVRYYRFSPCRGGPKANKVLFGATAKANKVLLEGWQNSCRSQDLWNMLWATTFKRPHAPASSRTASSGGTGRRSFPQAHDPHHPPGGHGSCSARRRQADAVGRSPVRDLLAGAPPHEEPEPFEARGYRWTTRPR